MLPLIALLVGLGAAGPASQPTPQPFPKPGAVQPARPAAPAAATPSNPEQAQGAPAAAPDAPPSEATLGVPILPGSQYIASYDAGRGQRYYLFGSATPFADVVAYYRTMLKQRGTLLFDVPGTHQFEVGRFREETMAFPPGVTVKDYVSEVSAGYPNPKPATQPAHFSTIVQIVPVTERR
jgi:hypothetical protein